MKTSSRYDEVRDHVLGINRILRRIEGPGTKIETMILRNGGSVDFNYDKGKKRPSSFEVDSPSPLYPLQHPGRLYDHNRPYFLGTLADLVGKTFHGKVSVGKGPSLTAEDLWNDLQAKAQEPVPHTSTTSAQSTLGMAYQDLCEAYTDLLRKLADATIDFMKTPEWGQICDSVDALHSVVHGLNRDNAEPEPTMGSLFEQMYGISQENWALIKRTLPGVEHHGDYPPDDWATRYCNHMDDLLDAARSEGFQHGTEATLADLDGLNDDNPFPVDAREQH